MLAYVASSPSGSNSTLVCGTVAPGDQQPDVWHAVAHGCFPAQHQLGISSSVKQAHATWNFNADTEGYQDLAHPPSWYAVGLPDLCGALHDGVCYAGNHLNTTFIKNMLMNTRD